MENNELIQTLKADIRAMHETEKDINDLVRKLDGDTETIDAQTDGALVLLKKKIMDDLAELESYTDPDIYWTRSLDIYDSDDRYGIKEGKEYPSIHIKIQFGQEGYNFNKDGTMKSGIAIYEQTHSYAPIYADGKFADEIDGSYLRRYHQEASAAFYRHWPGILAIAYEKLREAYKTDIARKLDDAVNRKKRAYKRQTDILASLSANGE